MSAGGPLAVLGGRELMRTSAPLLGDVGEGRQTVRDLHAMARMVHNGVPLADGRLHLRYRFPPSCSSFSCASSWSAYNSSRLRP